MPSRKRKFILTVVAVVIGILLGCSLGEIGTRLIAPPWLTLQMKEMNLARNAALFGSDVGWSVETSDGKFVRFVPNSHFDVHYYEYNHSVHIDQTGGRVVNSNKNNKGVVIPFLGDSFAFGIGVADDETFVNLSAAHSPYHFINLSVPGSALPNQLDQLEFRHKELKSPPVYVFAFFAGNDYADIYRYYSKIPQEKENDPGRFLKWIDNNIFGNRLLGKSYLLQLIKHTLFKRYFYTDRHTETLPESCAIRTGGKQVTNSALCIMAGNKQCVNEIDRYVKMSVERLDELSRKLRFTPIFLIIPEKSQVNESLLATKAARWGFEPKDLNVNLPDTIIENELERYGIRYIDLSECLKKSKDYYYRIDDHFTPAGHRAVSDYLAKRLDPMIADVMKSASK
jgi:hypothetical protein